MNKYLLGTIGFTLGAILFAGFSAQAATCAGVYVGGTGICYPNIPKAHTVILGSGSSALSTTTPNSAGYVLTSNGVNADPTFQNPTSGGTVTSITGGTGLNGGTITIAGTLSLKSYLATSTSESDGQLAYWTTTGGTPAKLGKVATSTLTASSPLTGSFTQIGSGGAIGCQTASGSQAGCLSSADWTTFNNKGTGTVMSIAAGNGLNGGTITNSGTISLKSYIATSTTETDGQLAYWTTTGGNPAKLSTVATSTLTATGLLSLSNSPKIIGTSGAVLTLPITKGYFAVGNDASIAQATSTIFISSTGFVGIASTTPFGLLSVNPNGIGAKPAFVIGSSTQTLFAVSAVGQIQAVANQPATTTAIVLNWKNTPQQVEYRIGGSAVTVTFIQATTSSMWGSRKLVYICNPNGTAGALTWKGVEWIGTAPTQTTTANQCDVYSFDITHATSTSAFKVAGSQGAGLK